MALPDEKDLLKPGEIPDDDIEVHIEGDVEVDIIDDTPEEDRNYKALPEGEAEPSDEEMEEYSDKVKKRLSKMRHGLHDERRAKEAATRERDAAVATAKTLLEEKKALESRYQQGEDAFINQAKEKVSMSMAEAKREFKAAYEIGDADAMAEAQEKISTIAAEKQRTEEWSRQSTQRKQNTGQPENDVIQSAHTSPPVPEPDPDAVGWAAKNKWFGADEEMTQFAYGVHAKLVNSGIDPKIDSVEYYKKLNTRMREVFPTYEWGDTQKRKQTSVVAPVNRTTKTARRVTLTQSQASVAKRLGLTPLQYATELAKLEN